MNTTRLVLFSICLTGLFGCSSPSNLRLAMRDHFEPANGFSGPLVTVGEKSYHTDYWAECRNDANESVRPHGGVGIIFEMPWDTSASLGGPSGPGIHRGDNLKFTLRSTDGRLLDQRTLHSGDVVLFERGSNNPVYLSRDWSPPEGASKATVLREFSSLIKKYQRERVRDQGSEQVEIGER